MGSVTPEAVDGAGDEGDGSEHPSRPMFLQERSDPGDRIDPSRKLHGADRPGMKVTRVIKCNPAAAV